MPYHLLEVGPGKKSARDGCSGLTPSGLCGSGIVSYCTIAGTDPIFVCTDSYVCVRIDGDVDLIKERAVAR